MKWGAGLKQTAPETELGDLPHGFCEIVHDRRTGAIPRMLERHDAGVPTTGVVAHKKGRRRTVGIHEEGAGHVEAGHAVLRREPVEHCAIPGATQCVVRMGVETNQGVAPVDRLHRAEHRGRGAARDEAVLEADLVDIHELQRLHAPVETPDLDRLVHGILDRKSLPELLTGDEGDVVRAIHGNILHRRLGRNHLGVELTGLKERHSRSYSFVVLSWVDFPDSRFRNTITRFIDISQQPRRASEDNGATQSCQIACLRP